MTNLATIQKVKNVHNHPNAEKLDLVDVLGWQVVTKRGEFKNDDLLVYIVIDTILPETTDFEFLRNKHFRIKPIRLRGEYSNGICFPLTILTSYGYNINDASEGTDVTSVLNIKKYEKPIPAELAGKMVGHIPGFLIITDEDNLRTYPDAVPEMYGRPYYITRKEDGSSGTYFIRNGEFGVCSRRIQLQDTEGNGFWKMAKKYDIENKLKMAFPDMDIAIQGEVVGPGIQKNKLGLSEMEFRLFNIFDIVRRQYFEFDKLTEFCKTYDVPMVPLVEEGSTYGHNLEDLIKLANLQTYPTGGVAEGIVVRPKDPFTSTALKKTWSGKVLNEKYTED